jgi:hypothetical protein
MKHLRPEFAKQLQFIQNSPKKTIRPVTAPASDITSILPPTITTTTKTTTIIEKSTEILSIENLSNSESIKEEIVMEQIVNNVVSSKSVDEPDKIVVVVNNNCDVSNKNIMNNIEKTMEAPTTSESNDPQLKDGNYFLRILELEKTRILKKADDTEKELQQLQSDVSLLNEMTLLDLLFIVFIFPFHYVYITPAINRSFGRNYWRSSCCHWQITFVSNKEIQTI